MSLEPSISIILLLYLDLLEVKYDCILSVTNLSTGRGTQFGIKLFKEVFSIKEGVKKEKLLKWVSYTWSGFSKIGLNLAG